MITFFDSPFKNTTYYEFKNNGEIVNGATPKTWLEVNGWTERIGMLLPNDILLLDIDDNEIGIKISNILRTRGIRHFEMKTNGKHNGWHFYFKNPSEREVGVVNSNNDKNISLCTLGKIDWKPGHKKQQACVKHKGEWRNWNDEFAPKSFILNSNDLDELPIWLYPIKKGSFDYLNGLDEGGREEALWKWTTYLIRCKYTKDEIREIIEIINNFLLTDPLDNNTIERQVFNKLKDANDEVEIKTIGEPWWDKNSFRHDVFVANYLKSTHVADIRGVKYFYNGQYYISRNDQLEAQFYDIDQKMKMTHRKEAIAALSLSKIEDTEKNLIMDPEWMSFRNGILNVHTKEFKDHDWHYFIEKFVDVEYKPEVTCPPLMKALKEWCVEGKQYGLQQDDNNLKILQEWYGYMVLARNTNYKRGIMLLWGSEADNGKSTCADVLLSIFNEHRENAISYLSISNLSQVKNMHDLDSLREKFVVYNDESPSKPLEDDCMDTLKVLNSPNANLTVRPAFSTRVIQFKSTAKFLISSNEVIYTSRKSNDWYNRILIVPFWNKFDGSKRDVDLVDKLKGDDCKSTLVNWALEGYDRLRKQGGFTTSIASEKALWMYKCQNDSVLRWIDHNKLTKDVFYDKSVQGKYEDYKIWLQNINGVESKAFNRNRAGFLTTIKQHFNLVPEVINNAEVFK